MLRNSARPGSRAKRTMRPKKSRLRPAGSSTPRLTSRSPRTPASIATSSASTSSSCSNRTASSYATLAGRLPASSTDTAIHFDSAGPIRSRKAAPPSSLSASMPRQRKQTQRGDPPRPDRRRASHTASTFSEATTAPRAKRERLGEAGRGVIRADAKRDRHQLSDGRSERPRAARSRSRSRSRHCQATNMPRAA